MGFWRHASAILFRFFNFAIVHGNTVETDVGEVYFPLLVDFEVKIYVD